MLKSKDLWTLEKKDQFCQLFSLETLKFHFWLDSNPWPCSPHFNPLSTIPNLLMKLFFKFLSQFLKVFYNLSVAESPVGSNNNRRCLLKRQKTRIVNNFWSRPNLYMKFSELYEKVLNLSDLCRISHEKVVHLKSDVHYCKYSTTRKMDQFGLPKILSVSGHCASSDMDRRTGCACLMRDRRD